MDDDSRVGNGVKLGLGALGLGAVAAVVTVPKYGIWIAVVILVLFLLLFGGYFLWRRMQARRQRERFSSAIEAQTAAAPKSISDPNKRAALDKLRQKFQTGMQEFRSRGKDIYKLPWHVIIGEPGSGKTEAIRHSGIDFPPGLQDELQGSGGTVNMDWWFTNRGIILDTAGSMIFGEASAGEAPEWREFLRLLKKSRPSCPINGLFLVLSIESLIKDSSDKIAQKASRLAQQLDLIQRALDVRFPVYLLVTKCDLLTGFREFFDSIDDPLLQHQIFGWSNPDPLDAHFRPDLVEQHLNSVAQRLRRRRMALLRDNSTAGRLGDTSQIFSSSYQLGRAATVPRRLDEVDAMFALPESIMRLAPRLRRYLETVFVAGEWSAKPVFLRGIYFTTSMREGKTLDEAISLATGLALDQLPEERNWEKNRAFFLRDLFHEKIFREAGLVTRATNTLQLLRTRQLAIFGTAGVALLALMIFAWFGYRSLNRSVRAEAAYWSAGANTNNWNQSEWSAGSIVHPGTNNPLHFTYAGTNQLAGLDEKLSVVEYHERLRRLVSKQLSVGWIFKPIFWIGSRGAGDRPLAQRILFEHGVLMPLVERTRAKMLNADATLMNPADVARHRDALQSLMQLEADGVMVSANGGTIPANGADRYLKTFVAYLTEEDGWKPDTNLLDAFTWTYSKKGSGDGKWPPKFLLGGNTLAANVAIKGGLEKFHNASMNAQTNIDQELALLNELTDGLIAYHTAELAWLTNATDPCSALNQSLSPKEAKVAASFSRLAVAANVASGPLTNIAMRYAGLGKAASDASAAALSSPVTAIVSVLPDASRTSGLFEEIQKQLRQFVRLAGAGISTSYVARSNWVATLDAYQLAPVNAASAHESRWRLYTNACALASAPITVDDSVIGDGWKRYGDLQRRADQFRTNLAAYNGPLADLVSNACNRIAGDAEQRLKNQFVGDYAKRVANKLAEFGYLNQWTPETVLNAGNWLGRIQHDLDAGDVLGPQKDKLAVVRDQIGESTKKVAASMGADIRNKAGFPVTLGASQTVSLQSLGGLRLLLNGLLKELQNPLWQGDGSNLRAWVQNTRDHLLALVTDEDSPSPLGWQISFVPAEQGTEDNNIIKVFPVVQVSLGQTKSAWENLSRAAGPVALGKGTVDQPVTIAFRRFGDDPSSEVKAVTLADWSLPRLLHDYNAERLDDGQRWRIKVKLEDKQSGSSGYAMFEIKPAKPLPKIEDWSK